MSARPDDTWTLGATKDWLRDLVDEGARCPCCGQHAKVYKRSIHASMAVGLLHMYRAGPAHHPYSLREHVPASLGRGDVAKLRYWGLLVPAELPTHGSRREGDYMVTRNGLLWLRDALAVPKYVRVYDSERLGEPFGEPWGIRDALGEKFDYEELMSR